MGTIILWTLLLAGVVVAQDDCFQRGKAITGNPLFKPGTNSNKYTDVATPNDCQAICQETEGCAWFNWKKQLCYLKSSPEGTEKDSKGGVTGPRECPAAETSEVDAVEETAPAPDEASPVEEEPVVEETAPVPDEAIPVDEVPEGEEDASIPDEASPVEEVPETPEEFPAPGSPQPTEVDEYVLAAAEAALASLAGVETVTKCQEEIELVEVEEASKQVVAGTNYYLTIRLAAKGGEDCSERQEKICSNIVVFEPLPFECEDGSGCHELEKQEDITCEDAPEIEGNEEEAAPSEEDEAEETNDNPPEEESSEGEDETQEPLLKQTVHVSEDGFVDVKTFLGIVKGKPVSSENGKQFYKFLGIPYAEAPVGSLRFMPPQPKTAWGTLEATEFGAECPQVGFLPEDKGKSIGDEDCLFLNVYTPQIPSGPDDSNLKPVMLWIHGGGFTGGSANFYDPSLLVEKDVVVVTINYRLGVLGMMTFGNNLVSGNMGLKDQHMAIKWVKNHIRHFGGDRNKITLFGESAGGISAHAHVISPYNKGLLAGAISQSGTMLYRNFATMDKKELEQSAKRLCKLVECKGNNLDENMLECLQSVSAEDLVSKTDSSQRWPEDVTKETVREFRANLFQWNPVVDYYAEKPFLPMSPLEALKSKSYNQIPFMSGTCKDDGALFSIVDYDKLGEIPNVWDSVGASTLGLSLSSSPQSLSDENVLLATIIRKYYTGNDFNIEGDNLINYSNMLGDNLFLSPDQKSVALMAGGDAPVYNYMLTYRGTQSFASTVFGGDPDVDFGVMHGDDLLYLFKNDLFPTVFEDEKEEKLSNLMVTYWTNFAKFGEPTPFDKGESVEWKPVKKDEMNYMDLKPEPDMKQNVAAERMQFWNRLIWADREKLIDRRILLKKVQKFFWSNRISQ